MAFVSVTRLRIRALRFLPRFVIHTLGSRRQCARSPGFLSGAVFAGGRRSFWTVTAWKDRESMRAYMTDGAHRIAMPHLLEWCDEASVVHWEQSDDALPEAHEAEGRMRLEGRPSKVRHPSPDHAALRFAKLANPRMFPVRPDNRRG
ncbi:DUF3291 domain-containing protein [Pararhizobium mangrovi]|uniref:DUF3291 domain-containing protein n=1 Tax=Pararhizobium mangrovi TaxID=2590452 RepID=A0A506TXH4_9HYPH|nr:DUF3291 domain-containing protein [Pararhizobium mangrovi]TPW26210.1 DUF3291 domain-containing protein [Pararhizobium mangrovi]